MKVKSEIFNKRDFFEIRDVLDAVGIHEMITPADRKFLLQAMDSLHRNLFDIKRLSSDAAFECFRRIFVMATTHLVDRKLNHALIPVIKKSITGMLKHYYSFAWMEIYERLVNDMIFIADSPNRLHCKDLQIVILIDYASQDYWFKWNPVEFIAIHQALQLLKDENKERVFPYLKIKQNLEIKYGRRLAYLKDFRNAMHPPEHLRNQEEQSAYENILSAYIRLDPLQIKHLSVHTIAYGMMAENLLFKLRYATAAQLKNTIAMNLQDFHHRVMSYTDVEVLYEIALELRNEFAWLRPVEKRVEAPENFNLIVFQIFKEAKIPFMTGDILHIDISEWYINEWKDIFLHMPYFLSQEDMRKYIYFVFNKAMGVEHDVIKITRLKRLYAVAKKTMNESLQFLP